ncbi:hypothetical protein [Halovivax gelatinilyticus]|uniref:hypothetical protein n=1 Tax=Halovivax gelatinilyticus TaxID=2961597 RepID=UPI0020CA514A|nr:hypothetical protein [Halovivax gelatinilyticus]
MFDLLRGLIRAAVAWIGGLLATIVVLASGLASSPESGLVTFLEAHAVVLGSESDPIWLAAIPAVAIGLVGFRTGSRLDTGPLGRLRASIASVLGHEERHRRAALQRALYLAVGYAGLVALSTALVGGAVGETALAALVIASICGTVGTLVGVR